MKIESTLHNHVGGAPLAPLSPAPEYLDVISPVDGARLTRVVLSGPDDLDAAVCRAADAFDAWSNRTLKDRTQVFFRYRTLLEANGQELAELVHRENGKTVEEGRAEVLKAIEITEFACSLPQIAAGEVLDVSAGVECRVEHAPLGVVASITPFNFPVMVPHWTIPIALCLGNTMILKPSEKVPLSAQRAAELLTEAGLPRGAFNVVHGSAAAVEAICDHPGIRAMSFVGSTPIAQRVYVRATGRLKRVLALGGAKNHLVVVPDADPEQAAQNIIASMAGCAGQRCMAASVLIAVGPCEPILERICAEARRWTCGRELGAVISAQAKERIERIISEAESQGARVLVDGRRPRVDGCEGGFYVGPTVLDGVAPTMRVLDEEVFGPVLVILRVPDLESALAIENASPYGNAAAIYTRSGDTARRFARAAQAGMLGVNVGVPVPREPFGFGGWNDSRFGSGDITGKSSIGLWTQSKKITTRW
ncbi:MAG: CoA-acylating methylmalonate-semialdehyde dehydrogenase [Planctomycetes bacterium]|nr:CoA-acylating methylmalonate-semialdehyde dehydrogenase [Planctomycetota bacterium]